MTVQFPAATSFVSERNSEANANATAARNEPMATKYSAFLERMIFNLKERVYLYSQYRMFGVLSR